MHGRTTCDFPGYLCYRRLGDASALGGPEKSFDQWVPGSAQEIIQAPAEMKEKQESVYSSRGRVMSRLLHRLAVLFLGAFESFIGVPLIRGCTFKCVGGIFRDFLGKGRFLRRSLLAILCPFRVIPFPAQPQTQNP